MSGPPPTSADDAFPLVDDHFWLRRAGELVTAGSTLRTDAARQLMSALTWLWTVYTGAAILGAIAASTRLSTAQAWALAMPSLTIVLAYSAAVYAHMPLTVSFEPRDPDDVRLAYTEAVRRGWRRLQVALGLSALAAGSLAVAIVVVTTSR